MIKFARFRMGADGHLEMNLGWGQGGTAAIRDYKLDLDSGLGSGGVTVYQSEWGNKPSLANLSKHVNIALKAGFGVGLTGVDPLVLDLDGDGVELTTEENSRVYFEFDSDGFGERTGWVRPDDGLLARDANGNGRIDGLTELFGDMATSGFAELSAYDTNADGIVDAADALFSSLRVWRDLDGDGQTDAGELKSLAEHGIRSLSLAHAAPAEPTRIAGHVIANQGLFTRTDGTTGRVADVAFRINQTDTRWLGDATVSAEAAALPQLAGFGEVKDLRLAMTGDADLRALVAAYVGNATNDLAALKTGAEAILYRWAGVGGVAATALGTGGLDARKLAFLEKYSGSPLMRRDAGGAVLLDNVEEVEALWADQVTRLTLRLVVQGPLAGAFAGIQYRADRDLLVAQGPSALRDLLRSRLQALPADPAAAAQAWADWAPLLGALSEGLVRHDANIVRPDFLFAQLVAAADGVAQPLSLEALATGLAIPNLRLGTAGADALARGATDGSAVYLMQGGDTATGGAGQDVYVLGRSIGQVVINDVEAKPAGDRLRFAFLSAGDVRMARDGNDLLITVKASSETVRVVGQFAPVTAISSDVLLSSNKGVEEVQFADGTVMEIPEIMSAVGTGTDGNDHMVGTMHSDVFLGGRGNDRLEGGDDADLYVVNAGEGQDVIKDVQTTPLLRAADMLIFGDDIAPEDLVFSRAGNGGDDLRITIGTGGQSLLIEGQFGYSVLGYNDKLAPNSRIEAFAFRHYGDSWSNKDLQQQMIAEASTDGNDEVLGFGDDDLFAATAGDDTLVGLDGADTYKFGRGSGKDVIDERARFVDVKVGMGGLSIEDEADMVRFGSGLTLADVTFSRPNADPHLVVTIKSTGETLTIRDQFAGFQTGPLGAQWLNRVEWFEFENGSRLSWQDVLADVTNGGDGADTLYGDLFADRMVGGRGNDHLSGLGYADTYVFEPGDGHDTIKDANPHILGAGFVTVDDSADAIQLGSGISASDIRFVRSGADLDLLLGVNGDRITIKGQDGYVHTGVFGPWAADRIEEIRFANGDKWSWQEMNRRMIAAATTAGNDETVGFVLEDRFEASAGDDVLRGGDSADTYVFGRGSGRDVIRESVSNVLYGDEDVVEFGPGVAPSDVAVARNGDDLVLSLASSGDTLTIVGEFGFSNWYTWSDVELFRFADGTTWTKDDIQVRLLRSTSGNDHLVGFMTGDVLDGGAGDDTLEGADGGDVYKVGPGAGNDTIREGVSNANLSDDDRLVFGTGVLPSEVTLTRDGDDLVLASAAHGFSTRIAGQFSFSNWFAWNDVERFEFADGTVWTDRDIANRLVGGTTGPDHLIGTFRSDVLDGNEGNDILEGGDGADRYIFGRGYGQDEIRESLSNANLSEDDQLEFGPGLALADLSFRRSGNDLTIGVNGTADALTIKGQFSFSNWHTWWDIDRFAFADGTTMSKEDVQRILLRSTSSNDHLVGFMSADVLDGGAGDDLLEGADGADTYLFGRGSGRDVIRESLSSANLSEDDVLRFGPGITVADLGFSRSGDHLTITIKGTDDSIKIEGQFSYQNWFTWNDVDRFEFADGAKLTKEQVQQMLLTGGPGNDHIVGFMTGDLIDGGAGNDILEGGDGSDTYLFGRGYGQDEIRETVNNANLSDNDTIRFRDGVLWSDLTFERVADGVRIGIKGATDTLTVPSQFATINDRNSTTWWDVENFILADGTAKTEGDVRLELLRSTDGDDHLIGFFTNDVLAGGRGNDLLEGGRGSDTYTHGVGDGHDVVSDFVLYQGSGGDKVVFGVGIAPEDVIVRRSTSSPADMVLNVKNGASSVTLRNQISGGSDWTIDAVQFADGTIWTTEQLARFAVSGATPGDDVIEGTPYDDQLSGAGGNDRLHGYDGNDFLDGGRGDDHLDGGNGDNTYRYAAGDGNDFLLDNGSRSDRLEFGPGITPDEVRFSYGNRWADLRVTFENQSGSIMIDDQFWSDDGVEAMAFADGTVWTRPEIAARYFAAQRTDGDDVIRGTTHADTIYGGAGNDTLAAWEGDDVLVGGLGDDRLEGGSGDNTYRYAAGDGNDFLLDDGSRNDRLEFGSGIAPADVRFSHGTRWADVRVTFANQSGSIVLDDQSWSDDGVESMTFADGTVWTKPEIFIRYFAAQRTDGDDVIRGTTHADTIYGGAGNDTLAAWEGDDVLIGGLGNDRLEGGTGTDQAIFSGLRDDYSITTANGSIHIDDNEDTRDGDDGTDTLIGVETAEFKGGTKVSLAAPIVLDLDGDGVELVSRNRSKARFDWNGDGKRDSTGWIGKGDGLLVYDRDGNGSVSGASELSFLDDKPGAKSDLDGLSAFDSNADGAFDGADRAWADFRVWKDADRDGKVDRGELVTMAQAGVASISLTGQATAQSWGMDDNVVVNNGSFTRLDGTAAALGDVALNYKASRSSFASMRSAVVALGTRSRSERLGPENGHGFARYSELSMTLPVVQAVGPEAWKFDHLEPAETDNLGQPIDILSSLDQLLDHGAESFAYEHHSSGPVRIEGSGIESTDALEESTGAQAPKLVYEMPDLANSPVILGGNAVLGQFSGGDELGSSLYRNLAGIDLPALATESAGFDPSDWVERSLAIASLENGPEPVRHARPINPETLHVAPEWFAEVQRHASQLIEVSAAFERDVGAVSTGDRDWQPLESFSMVALGARLQQQRP